MYYRDTLWNNAVYNPSSSKGTTEERSALFYDAANS